MDTSFQICSVPVTDYTTLLTNYKITHLIHLSDIHIRPIERHEEYQIVFQNLYKQLRYLECVQTKHAIIILTGDIFHSKLHLSSELIQITGQFFLELDKIAPVLIILGNHDLNLQNKDRSHALSVFFETSNQFYTQFNQTWLLNKTGVYQFGTCLFHVPVIDDQRFIPASLLPDGNYTHKICLYHGGVGDYSLENGIIQHSNIGITLFDGYDCVLLGDIHLGQFLDASKKRIAYAGSFIQQNRCETYKNHGFLLWNLTAQTNEWHEVLNPEGFCIITIHPNQILFHPRNNTHSEHRIEYIVPNTPPEITDSFWEQLKWEAFQNRAQTYLHINIPHNFSIDEWTILLTQFFTQTYQFNPERIKVVKHYTESSLLTFKHQTAELQQWNIQAIENQTIFTEFLNTIQPSNYNLPGGSTWTTYVYDKVLYYYNQTIQYIQNYPDLYRQKINEYTARQADLTGSPLTPHLMEWSNLLCYDEKNVLDFDQMKQFKIFNISGKNYSGKSAIIDILLYALYGKTYRGRGQAKQILGVHARNGSVLLIFSILHHKYRITRQFLTKRKEIEQNLLLEQWIQNEWKNQNEEGMQKTQKKIDELIGPMKLYTDGPIFLQGEADDFFRLTPSERKTSLLKKLNFDLIDKLIEHLKEKQSQFVLEVKLNRIQYSKIQDRVQQLITSCPLSELEFTDFEIKNLYPFFEIQHDLFHKDCSQAIHIAKEKRTRYLQQLQKPIQPQKVPGTIQECNQKIIHLQQKLQTSQEEQIEQSRLKQLLQEKMPFIQSHYKTLVNQQSKIMSDLIQLRVQYQMNSSGIWNHETMETIQIKLKQIQQQILQDAPEFASLQENMQQIQIELEEFTKEEIELEQKYIEQYHEFNHQKQKINDEIQQIQLFLQKFNEKPHPDCHFCSKNPQIQQFHQFSKQLPVLTESLQQVQKQITNYKNTRNKQLCSLFKQEYENKELVEASHQKIAKPIENQKIAQRTLQCIQWKEQITELTKQQEQNQIQITELGLFLKENHALPSWISVDMIGQELKINNLLLQKIIPSFIEIQRELEYEESKKQYHERFQQETKQYDFLWNEYQLKLSELQTLDQTIQVLEKQYQQQERWLNDVKQVGTEYNELPELKKQEEELIYQAANIQLFGHHGFPFFLIQKIINEMIHVLNSELNQLTDFQIQAEFDQGERKADKSDIHFYIVKHSGDAVYDLQQGSGFERFMTAILWRIHTSRMYHPARLMPLNWIIFDESFHFWDQTQLGQLGLLFQHLYNYAPNILVISHIPQVTELANEVLTIHRNGLSHICYPHETIQLQNPVVILKQTEKQKLIQTAQEMNIPIQKQNSKGKNVSLSVQELREAITQKTNQRLFMNP